MNTSSLRLVWLAATLLVAACGSAESSSRSAATCIAGRSNDCACGGGATGVQVCQPDGRFGTCVCRDGGARLDVPTAVTPDDAAIADVPVEGGAADIARDTSSPGLDVVSTVVSADGGIGTSDVPQCPATLIRCGERCVDPQTDAANCGGCGTACTLGRICAAGTCAPPCDLAGPWGAPRLVPGANSASFDFSPTLTADELTMYFGSDRPGSSTSDIYVARRSSRSEAFGAVTPVSELNSSGGDGHPAVSGDGRTIFFQSGRMGNERLFAATRADTSRPFGPVQYLASIRGSDLDDGVPFASLTGDRLYWLKGQFGRYDLYAATVTDATTLGTPTPMSELNTSSQENGVVVSADGLTAFWGTDRAGGRLQIWTATRTSPSLPFGGARVVDELASPGVDVPDWISPDQCRLYFTSNRPGATGGFDMWVTERPLRAPTP